MEEETNESAFLNLPDEIQAQCLSFVPETWTELVNMRNVCKKMQATVNDPFFQKLIAKKIFEIDQEHAKKLLAISAKSGKDETASIFINTDSILKKYAIMLLCRSPHIIAEAIDDKAKALELSFYSTLLFAQVNPNDTINLVEWFDQEHKSPYTTRNTSPLIEALLFGNEEIVDLLLAFNVDVNAKNSDEITPLFIAITSMNPTLIKLLLENGAVITPLVEWKIITMLIHYALFPQLAEVLTLLIKNMQVDQESIEKLCYEVNQLRKAIQNEDKSQWKQSLLVKFLPNALQILNTYSQITNKLQIKDISEQVKRLDQVLIEYGFDFTSNIMQMIKKLPEANILRAIMPRQTQNSSQQCFMQ